MANTLPGPCLTYPVDNEARLSNEMKSIKCLFAVPHNPFCIGRLYGIFSYWIIFVNTENGYNYDI